jgi:hypothetical protein
LCFVSKLTEAPVYFTYPAFDWKGLKFVPFIGGTIAYNLESEVYIERSDNTTLIADISDRFEYLSYAAMAGIAVRTQISGVDFSFDLRYSYGLNDMINLANKERYYMRYASAGFSVFL